MQIAFALSQAEPVSWAVEVHRPKALGRKITGYNDLPPVVEPIFSSQFLTGQGRC